MAVFYVCSVWAIAARRLETTVYKKLNRKAKERQSETEVLAETMLTASATLGTDTPYGWLRYSRDMMEKKYTLIGIK